MEVKDMPEVIGAALIEEAVNTVKATISSIKSRARLLTSKVRDITEDLDSLTAATMDNLTLLPTTELLTSTLALNSSLIPFKSIVRARVNDLEAISDRLELLIP